MSCSNGANILPTAHITTLKDTQLARSLAHHKFVMHMPADWFVDPITGEQEAATIMATRAHAINGYHFVDCKFLSP